MMDMIRLVIVLSAVGRLYVDATRDSCVARCGQNRDRNVHCQCNSVCTRYNDCCYDYQSYCLGGEDVCDMSCIAQKLWNNDVNKIPLMDVSLNYQGQTTSKGTTDMAATNLFTFVSENHLNCTPTFQKFIALLDNYNTNIGQADELTPAELDETENFLNTIIPTQVMQLAYRYLFDKGLVGNVENFKDLLRQLWFNMYSRSSSRRAAVDSSGFEHTMVGELRSKVSGFHNWIQFYLEEKKGNINYLGWISKSDPDIIVVKFTWHGQVKSRCSFFIRTSPEFELALYSICALTKPGSMCSFNMTGHHVRIQTWDIRHKAGLQIASAYPVL